MTLTMLSCIRTNHVFCVLHVNTMNKFLSNKLHFRIDHILIFMINICSMELSISLHRITIGYVHYITPLIRFADLLCF